MTKSEDLAERFYDVSIAADFQGIDEIIMEIVSTHDTKLISNVLSGIAGAVYETYNQLQKKNTKFPQPTPRYTSKDLKN